MHAADLLATAAVDNPLPLGLSSNNRLLHNHIADHPSPNATDSSFALLLYGNTRETLEHLLLVVLAYIVVCLAFYRAIFSRYGRSSKLLQSSRFPSAKRVLLVTAHPDDESMFFGPTILSLIRRKNCKIYLLCLSNGKQSWHTTRHRVI